MLMAPARRRAMSIAVLIAFPLHAATAQATATSIISGRVTGEGIPVVGATVRLRLVGDTALRVRLTGSDGRYQFGIPSTTSQAILEIRRLGYSSAHRTLSVHGRDEVQDFDLRGIPGVIEGMTIRSKPVRQATGRVNPGDSDGRAVASALANYPVDVGSIAEMASFLNPGILTGLQDSTGGLGSSIGGQPPSQTSATIDGGSAGSTNLPSEATASVTTFTSTYDVSRGQFSGGQVAVATRNGTDTWKAAFNVTDRDRRLQITSGSALAQPASSNARIGMGIGGPIVRHWLYGYAALDLTESQSTVRTLDVLSPASLGQLGFAADSIARLRAIIAGLGFAVPPGAPPTTTQAANGMLRFDMPLSVVHTLTTRIDWRDSRTTGNVHALSLGDPGAIRTTRDAGVLVGLNSGTDVVSSRAHVYLGHSSIRTAPGLATPGASVLLRSAIGDSAQAGIVAFGNLTSPSATTRGLTEVAEDLVFGARTSAHHLAVGVVVRDDRGSVAPLANVDGMFSFSGLPQVAAGAPSLFTRTLSTGQSEASSQYAAVYVGDAWIVSPGLRVGYGLRADGSRYAPIAGSQPAPTVLVGNALAQPPADWSLSPRAGFTYASPGARWLTVRGGLGAFRGLVPIQTLAGTAAQTSSLVRNLVCTGADAPSPDWRAFESDPSAIPTACAARGDPSAASVASATTPVSNALVYARDYTAPRVWHGSLGTLVSHGLLTLELETRYSLSTNQPTAVDRNLLAAPQFTLANEQHRPVFAASDAINPASGTFLPFASRIQSGVGTVREISSEGVTRDLEISTSLGGVLPPGHFARMFAAVLYTYRAATTSATAIPAPGGSIVPTAALPNERASAPVGFIPTHVISLFLARNLVRDLNLTMIASERSGAPFTPLVGSDINGDGYANDRAFVYDPHATLDSALAAGLTRTIAAADPTTRRCLTRQLGTVAGAGSCRTPWSWSANLQLNYRPRDHRDNTFSLTTVNAPAAFDLLMHGANGLRGWGQPAFPDPALLYVRGFDAATRTFRYAANANFGATRGALGYGQPFGVQFRVRHTLGSDPAQIGAQPVRAAPTDDDVRASFHTVISNTPAIVLRLADSLALALDAAQIIALQDNADALGARVDTIVSAVLHFQQTLNRPGYALELQRVMTEQRAAARSVIDDGVRLASGILRPDQWIRVPRVVREPARDVSLNDGRTILLRP
jgi:hypothetical protein